MQETRDAFQVEDSIAVSDPCYGEPSLVIEDAQPGAWTGEARVRDGRIGVLFAHHEDFNRWDLENARWVHEGTIPVDSGQAGVWTSDYPAGEGEYDDEGSFYGRACAATRGETDEDDNRIPISMNDIIEEGIVSQSGHGDGRYDVFVVRDGGEVVAVQIEYIKEDDEYVW